LFILWGIRLRFLRITKSLQAGIEALRGLLAAFFAPYHIVLSKGLNSHDLNLVTAKCALSVSVNLESGISF